MAYQLIYTSVPRGLVPGRSGYTIAARHRQIRDRLVSEIERISRYAYSKDGSSPVIYAHRIFDISGVIFHVFTRIVDAGSDYTGRTNYLAHHLICDSKELSASGAKPAEILEGHSWVDSFQEEPRYFDDHEIIDLSRYAGSLKLPANNWKLIRGEAADAALLVENKSKNKNSILVFAEDDHALQKNLIRLFSESSCLLSSPNQITFTTYFQEGDVMSDFKWIGCEINNAIVQKPTNREVFHLGNLDQKTPETDLAQLAIKGVLTPKPDINVIGEKNLHAKSTSHKSSITSDPSNLPQSKSGLGDGMKVPSVDIPNPSIKKQKFNQSHYSNVSTIGREVELDDPFYIKYLKHIVVGSISGVLVIAGLFFYLTSFQPKQQLQINIERYVAEKKYIEANKYLDKVLSERSAWRDMIAGIRKEKVFEPMHKLTSQKINQFVGSSPDRKKERYEIAKLQISDLQDFINYFSSGSSEAAKISELIVTYSKAEKRYLESINSEVVKNTNETETKPETKNTASTNNNVDNNQNNIPEVSKKIIYSPSSLYLILNSGNLNEIILPESLRRLTEDESGKLMINVKGYQLPVSGFPIFNASDSERIKYKFPETAEEENDDMFPLSGSANIELKFQGAGSLYLIKNQADESKTRYDFWAAQKSNLISFSEGRASLDVLLWNGVPFEPKENHFKYNSGNISLDKSLTNMISALSKGPSEELSPQKAILKFTPFKFDTSNTEPYVSEITLGSGQRDRLIINLQGLSGGGLELLTKLEMQIDERLHLINKGGGDYVKWMKEASPYEKNLRETAVSLLGKNNDLLTQYRRIFDQNDQRRVRSDIQNFLLKLIEEYAENLRDEGVKRDVVEIIKEELCETEFPDLWESRDVNENKGDVFTEFIKDFAEECEDLSNKRAFGRDRKDFQLTYYINSNTARKALVKLAKTLEDQYSGPFGEELWDFTFIERPKAPNNINQIKRFQLEVESLKEKKIEAEKKLKNFTPPKEGELPKGRYEIIFVFGDDKSRSFIVTNIEK